MAPAAIVSGLAGPHSSVHGLPPWNSTTMLSMTMKPIMVTSEAITARTGATTTALATFESTVCASDTGSDFQHSTLRYSRSPYTAPRPHKNTTTPSTINDQDEHNRRHRHSHLANPT